MVNKKIRKIEKTLKKSLVKLPISLKLKLAKLILNLMLRRKKRFGLFIILGWKNKWKKFTNVSDITQNIFTHHHINIVNIKIGEHRHYDIGTTVNFDGAILINNRGEMVHSGVVIEAMRPGIVANKINPGHFKDLSEQLGFKKKVHLRHLTAITVSYVFKNTTVFTVSEETGSFHIFEKGRIIYSTVLKEI
ncbi:MAG: diadenylate cyclase, partial [Candidatus Azambacteria bacterium]|nr:diadenylate cyclase [Candidatus Azambacteria bacterium]